MRSAWKFADLKPRIYYCVGGEMYFLSRYVRQIAIYLMNGIPSTRINRRKDMTTQLFPSMRHDTVVAWDFSNFTTKLSELKYFLHDVFESLRIKYPDLRITIVDSHLGPILVHPSDLLEEYNQGCNVLASFSIARMIDQIADLDLSDEEYHQQNSGMLGVHGNIGFSTANHGFVTCLECGIDRCVCVGDDALGVVREPEQLIDHMQTLGDIAPEKFNIMVPGDEGPIRFLKRGLYRYEDYFQFDYLLNLPHPIYIDGRVGYRTIEVPDFEGCRYRVVTTIGALLWNIYDRHVNTQDVMEDDEIKLLRIYLNSLYIAFKLPRSGFLPGANIDGKRLHYACPPIVSLLEHRFDPRKCDWLEYLFDNHLQDLYLINMYTEKSGIRRLFAGETVYCGQNRLLTLLEDLEMVKTRPLSEMVTNLTSVNKRTIRITLGRVHSPNRVTLLEVFVIVDIPAVFDSLFIGPYEERSNVALANYM